MTNKDKIALVDRLLEELKEEAGGKQVRNMVGTLTRPQGLKGFHKCDIGHPVFQKDDRYVLYMESIDGKTVVEVPYYIETLQRAMKICNVYEPANDQQEG